MITAHHIVIDGWSLPVFVAEMMILYRAGGDLGALPIAPRPIPGLHRLACRPRSGSQPTGVACASRRPAGPTLLASAFGGEDAARTSTALPQSTELQLDAEATERLVSGARSRGVTLNTLLQTAWALIVSRLTDRDESYSASPCPAARRIGRCRDHGRPVHQHRPAAGAARRLRARWRAMPRRAT